MVLSVVQHRLSAFHGAWLTFLCLQTAGSFAATINTGPQADQHLPAPVIKRLCNKDIRQHIAPLVNFASISFGGVSIGTLKTGANSLTQALALSHEPKTLSASGLAVNSGLETHLINSIFAHPCFASFAKLLNRGQRDIAGNNRATLHINMPLAISHIYNVEYLRNKIRRNFLFQTSFSFELRDNEGKLVFLHTFADTARRTCFLQGASDDRGRCVDFEDQAIDVKAEWRAIFNTAIDRLLLGVYRELPLWSEVLTELRGQVFDRRYRQQRDVDGHAVRQYKKLDIPYLWVQSPINTLQLTPLVEKLQAYGLTTGTDSDVNLQQHYQLVFRNALEYHLRAAIGQKKNLSNARVLMLSATQSSALQQAVMIACAQQSKAYTQQDCRAGENLLKRVCLNQQTRQTQVQPLATSGQCVRVYLMLANPTLLQSKQGLASVREAKQRVDAASFIDTLSDTRAPIQIACYNTTLAKNTLSLSGHSETYYRVDDQVENDDSIYLMDAAIKVIHAQAACIAEQLLAYHQSM
ncbi:MAG: hypothetical protein KTR20_07440 [Cellvibrionaceae bacterium]|nr:hypothetical protein [Cellvibrionaceae bacterium]